MQGTQHHSAHPSAHHTALAPFQLLGLFLVKIIMIKWSSWVWRHFAQRMAPGDIARHVQQCLVERLAKELSPALRKGETTMCFLSPSGERYLKWSRESNAFITKARGTKCFLPPVYFWIIFALAVASLSCTSVHVREIWGEITSIMSF